MPEVLYQKIGRKYVPAGEFHTNPAEGIWLVQKIAHGSCKRVIMRVGEIPDAVPLIQLEFTFTLDRLLGAPAPAPAETPAHV